MTTGNRAWYMGTSDGLFLVERNGDPGACVGSLGLRNTGGFRAPVVVDCADPQRLYAGTTRAGLFRSEDGWVIRSQDGGASWQQLDQGVPHDTHTIRFVPGTAGTLVLGTNDGMFRSTDRGDTWSAVNDGLEGRRYTPAPLVTRASRPGVLFSSTAAVGPGGWRRPEGGDAAFCRSDDGG